MMYMIVAQVANLQTQYEKEREGEDQECVHWNNERENRRNLKASMQQTRALRAQQIQVGTKMRDDEK